MLSEKPKKRSRIRRWAGSRYFIWRRLLHWHFTGTKFALTKQGNALPFLVAEHSTPLYRKLRNVDMWVQENKVHNLRLAIQHLDQVLIRPGETFSFWRLLGKPTAKKGYRKGMILSEGSFYAGTGGGLCQLANLLYWMTLHTPLTIKERWRHSYDVFPDNNRTQPFGSGATVSYNYIDLQIENNTTNTYQLLLWLDETHLHGRLLSADSQPHTYQVYEAEHSISHEWWGGYMRHNILRRKVLDDNNTEVNDEYVVENHAIMMYEPLLPG
ncbi:MAG: VanW family protein [Clostridiales bacterium]|jgi:vancomycin resistance protein VanW|nr:VanW family protein [Clostridiales bacterium]